MVVHRSEPCRAALAKLSAVGRTTVSDASALRARQGLAANPAERDAGPADDAVSDIQCRGGRNDGKRVRRALAQFEISRMPRERDRFRRKPDRDDQFAGA